MRAQSAATVLREAISVGEYSPGEKLNEVAVAEKLGVSRNTLREGFAVLATDGIIDRVPNRGVFIASPGADAIRHLYRARAVIEPGSLLWGDALDVNSLDSIVIEAEESRAAESPSATALANQRFHRTVVESAGSDLLNEEMDRLLARMRLVFLTVEEVRPGLHGDFVPMNRQVVSLLRAGDGAGAATLLRSSLVKTGETLAATVG